MKHSCQLEKRHWHFTDVCATLLKQCEDKLFICLLYLGSEYVSFFYYFISGNLVLVNPVSVITVSVSIYPINMNHDYCL